MTESLRDGIVAVTAFSGRSTLIIHIKRTKSAPKAVIIKIFSNFLSVFLFPGVK